MIRTFALACSILLGYCCNPMVVVKLAGATPLPLVPSKGATDLLFPPRAARTVEQTPGPSVSLDLGPLIGDITPVSARVWARAAGRANFSVRVGAKADLSDGWEVPGPALDAASDFMGKVRLTRLQPSSRYFYCVLLDGKPAMPQPYPSFLTAPERDQGHVRFAFGSCVGHQGFDSAATWADMSTRTNFDLLLMLGDNHYADTTDPKVFLNYFGVQRRLAGYQEIARRVPQYAIWDNHDYSPEPCDRTARDKERSLQSFKNFWPNPSAGEASNPGVYHKFSRVGVDFFMLDDRYHRSPDNSIDDGTKTLLGERQLDWLKESLLASKARVKVIGCGCEWESIGIKNSWMTFRRERDALFKFIEDHNITGVLLLSGDRHFTAAYQVTGKFIEVTSGPLGSQNAETKPTSEMFWYSGKGKFYCIYDIDTFGPDPKIVLEIYKASEGLVLRRPFTWDEVIGATPIKRIGAGG